MSKQQEPKVVQSPVTHEWYITTKYTELSDNFFDAETKHIIPKHVIANIAWDYLLREQMKDCDKGYEISVNTPTDGAFLVSVRREDSDDDKGEI